MNGTDCTCDLADVSDDGMHPKYVRGESRGCLVHATNEERELIAGYQFWSQELERRRGAAMRAAREAP